VFRTLNGTSHGYVRDSMVVEQNKIKVNVDIQNTGYIFNNTTAGFNYNNTDDPYYCRIRDLFEICWNRNKNIMRNVVFYGFSLENVQNENLMI
jgi:hypothetical protein